MSRLPPPTPSSVRGAGVVQRPLGIPSRPPPTPSVSRGSGGVPRTPDTPARGAGGQKRKAPLSAPQEPASDPADPTMFDQDEVGLLEAKARQKR